MSRFLGRIYKQVALCTFIFSQPVFSGSMGSPDSLLSHQGLYIGGDIGLSNLIDAESHLIVPESHQLGAMGIVGGGFVGYDYTFAQRWTFGAEAFINANGLNTNISHAPYSYKQNARYNFGVRALPKYFLTPNTDVHLVLGYTQAHFNLSDNGVYGLLNTDYNKSGFQGGLGFTTALCQNILLRLDALYSTYASQSSTGTGSNSSALINQIYQNQFSTLEGDLSLIYKFN